MGQRYNERKLDELKIGIFADFESLEKKNCDETIAHEIRHGEQIARGKLILKTDQSNYNTKHEVDAYRAQWSWSNNGFYLETTLNENGQLITPFKINRKFIYTILNKQKKLLYENLPYQKIHHSFGGVVIFYRYRF